MIQHGMKVRDNLSGFEGTVTAISDWAFGCIRIKVEPNRLDEKGAPIQNQVFDEQRLDIIDDKGAIVPDIDADPPIEMGWEVKDSITGFKGIVVCRTTHISGLVIVQVAAEKMKEGKPVEEQAFEERRLVKIEAKKVKHSKDAINREKDAPQGDQVAAGSSVLNTGSTV